MGSMSEVASILDDIRSLPNADMDFNLDATEITLLFLLYNEYGKVSFRIIPEINEEFTTNKFRQKLYSVAISNIGGGKPRAWDINTVKGKVGSHAIRILTNLKEWKVCSLQYDSINF